MFSKGGSNQVLEQRLLTRIRPMTLPLSGQDFVKLARKLLCFPEKGTGKGVHLAGVLNALTAGHVKMTTTYYYVA